LPQPKGLQSTGNTNKTLRKTVSINSFPQPPRGDHRMSMPSSPLAQDKSKTARKSKSSKESMHVSYSSGSTPSFLNGSGDGKAVSNVRTSDGLTSVSSPPHSRSSSAQDSYSTSATTYDDPAEGSSHKTDAADKRSSKLDGKGNVVVSVRVRPDANPDHKGPEGEWMVDGRKSLISFRGKEGGDHYYGKLSHLFL
jgi:centromeric protein E